MSSKILSSFSCSESSIISLASLTTCSALVKVSTFVEREEISLDICCALFKSE